MTLRHAPGLKRSAAALRVAAGSHDVPLAWPGLAHFLDGKLQLRLIDHPDELPSALGPDVGVVYLSHVDYRSSTRLDMTELNRYIREAGAMSLWDLSHSAGAVAIALRQSDAGRSVSGLRLPTPQPPAGGDRQGVR